MADETTSRSYTVVGMTCAHCKAAVDEEVGRVSGVSHVEVDLESGLLSVRGHGFTDEAVEAAVDEAGYQVGQA